ncbi:MAG TPA: hypothetical protein DDZ39_00715 [Flavobacteriaceae bacterium]|jgi:hypothetical protein|nr:hypothetical protein [Flavobacteriaceae bacterium]
MKKKLFLILKKIITISIYCIVTNFNGQNIKGYVLDEITKEPLISASVYFNNTTLGVITNNKGYFEIEKPKIKTELVISFLGYKDKIIKEFNEEKINNFLMIIKSNELDEVIIYYNDPLTREQKLRMFRKDFLGNIKNKKCKIENENDLILRYNSRNKTLKVRSKKPIIIFNDYLGYKLEFSLIQFLTEYKGFGGKKVSYYGTTKFSTLTQKKKYIKRRKKTYLGSTLHFMRSIYTNSLKLNKFGFIKKGMIVNAKSLIEIKVIEKIAHIKTKTDTLSIVYYKNKRNKQSKIIIESREFIIDEYGNYSSNPQILFSGEMGSQKTCQMLPLNYSITKE